MQSEGDITIDSVTTIGVTVILCSGNVPTLLQYGSIGRIYDTGP